MGDSATSLSVERDPGPMARFAEMVAEDGVMGVLVQRLADGETLAEIARKRGVPYGRLAAWITESRERTEQYGAGLKLRAEAVAQETLGIADGIDEQTKGSAAKAKVQIDTRFRLAAVWDRERYGEQGAALIGVNLDPLSELLKEISERKRERLRTAPAGDVVDAVPAESERQIPAARSYEEI